MKKHFCSLPKGFFKKSFAAVLALCMLFALAPNYSLSTLAAGRSENYARNATISTNVEGDDWLLEVLKNLNDGDSGSSSWRTGWTADAAKKDYYQLNWSTPVSVNQVSMVVSSALNQAPVAWHIQVSKDGETDWTDVAKVIDIQWTGNGTETKNLTFDLQENVKGLRVWIDAAHLTWSGYAIAEIEVYNDSDAASDPMPEELKSLTVSAKLTTNVSSDSLKATDLAQINDGMHVTGSFRTGMSSTAPGSSGTVEDYYQFDWVNPVSVNQVDLTAIKATCQAPTAWHVEVSTDGNSWKKVASVSDVQWENYDETTETKKLKFDLQEGIKGLRVYIDAAYLEWSGYGIQEIEAFNAPADSKPEDPKKVEPVNGNYAPVAEVSTNVARDAFTSDFLKGINDGKLETFLFRTGNAAEIEGKDYYQFTWEGPVSVNQVVLTANKTDKQAPTAWHVEVSTDGENWTKVASVSGVKWKYSWSETMETKKLTFALQENILGLRVYIDKANLDWNGYGIQEIEVFNASSDQELEDIKKVEPVDGNYAPVAEVSTNVASDAFTSDFLKGINDGKFETLLFRSGNAAEIEGKDYYQFTWEGPVSVDQVVLAANKTDKQAPTAWHVEVSTDGENWTKVASVSGVKWRYSWSETVETKKLTFALQENILGLRVYIDKANLDWDGYGIQEIEIRKSWESPRTGDDMPVAPIMLVLVISVVGVVTGATGYRKNRKCI